ncbi:hypothetical protein NN561_006707 [Cricetulus griseus]
MATGEGGGRAWAPGVLHPAALVLSCVPSGLSPALLDPEVKGGDCVGLPEPPGPAVPVARNRRVYTKASVFAANEKFSCRVPSAQPSHYPAEMQSEPRVKV